MYTSSSSSYFSAPFGCGLGGSGLSGSGFGGGFGGPTGYSPSSTYGNSNSRQ